MVWANSVKFYFGIMSVISLMKLQIEPKLKYIILILVFFSLLFLSLTLSIYDIRKLFLKLVIFLEKKKCAELIHLFYFCTQFLWLIVMPYTRDTFFSSPVAIFKTWRKQWQKRSVLNCYRQSAEMFRFQQS